ncbi:TldD/PmbA family protein [Oricola cellulosilytica]|uniref:TldD/PmbA family protein n=1 Tax=Oricola cellulosilytica TaxID=1429082 RepID=A0A4R0PJ41_9HYPH|nr:TldD/PmbA family protein [Oricola cellulosilytica]TCD16644.1 TldD/PmbA family protein [Oricola cellulosilytica]
MEDHTQSLIDRASSLVDAARTAGADAADAVVARSSAKSVSVRLGKVEGTDASESDNFSLRVFVGNRVASISANRIDDSTALAERAVAMARVSPEDRFNTLAPEDRLARKLPDLDLFDETDVAADRLTRDALDMEDAARSVEGVSNSSGANASAGSGGMVLVTSHGFSGSYRRSGFSRSVSVIAGSGTEMERDYDYSSKLFFRDLRSPEEIGREAGERTVRRLGPRKVPTQTVTAVYDPRVARGVLGHLSSAINGASVARKTSFLRDMMDRQVANSTVTVVDEPLKIRGQASRPFDGEGVSAKTLKMVDEGMLRHWFLSTSIAAELGLETNGRGARNGTTVSASSTNLVLEPGDASPEDMMKSIGTGFYVTEVFGQGVNMVTGEYSRGASGFWIEDGEIAFPVSEVTIASNLRDMFLRMVPANDLDRDYATAAPTLMIEGMTLAGQ